MALGKKLGTKTGKHDWPLLSRKRGPDNRSDLTRKRRKIRTCKVPTCTFIARRGWRKGFCIEHAVTHGIQDLNPKRSHLDKKRVAPAPAPDVLPFPPRDEDAELLCLMQDEDLAKWQSDLDADNFQHPLRAQDKQMLSKLIFIDSKTKAKAKKKEKPLSQVTYQIHFSRRNC